MTDTRIALGQMTSSIDPATNMAEIRKLARQARDGGAIMLFLPEMALILDRDRQRSAQWISSEAESPWPRWLQDCAREYQLWIHAGSAPFTLVGQKRVNRSLVFSPGGGLVARYDKIHMFDVDLPSGESWRESSLYMGGDHVALIDTPLGRLGLTICYDLRFPELYQELVGAGATLIAIPAAFTVSTGAAHWHVLLRARAIETGCYVIAAAQAGQHDDGRQTYGHSMVVDPWGRIIAEAPSGEASAGSVLIFADIDPAAVTNARTAVPLDRSRAARRWQSQA